MKKLLPNPTVVLPEGYSISQSDLEYLIANLPGANKDLNLDDLIWTLKGKRCKYTFDFSKLSVLSQKEHNWVDKLGVDLVLLAKTLLLLATDGLTSPQTIREYFSWIGKMLFFLADQNLTCIGRNNLVDFISFQIKHDYLSAPSRRLRLLPYRQFLLGPSTNQILQIVSATGLPTLVDRSVTERLYMQACKVAVESYGKEGMTFADWKDGGSFNFLTLDYGQFYIEHCLQIFEKHYPMAFALQSVLSNAEDIFRNAGIKLTAQSIKKYSSYLVRAVNGLSTTPNKRRFSQPKWELIVRLAQNQYEQIYRAKHIDHNLVSEHALQSASDVLGIPLSSPDVQDWFRQMVELVLEFDSDTTLDKETRSNAQSILGSRLDLEKLRQYLMQQINGLLATCVVAYPTQSFFQQHWY